MKKILHHIIALFVLGILIFTFVWACSKTVTHKVTDSHSKQQSVECRVVQHVRGEACIPSNPDRIVTFAGYDK